MQEGMVEALYEGNTLVIAQAGAGKTACAQTAIQELVTDGHLRRVVIFAPKKVCQLTWAKEYTKWEHLWEPEMALGDIKQRFMACMSDNPIVVLSLDNLAWFFENNQHVLFDGMLIDEGSKIKDPGSSRFKKMRHKLKHFAWRSSMSATPVHESAADLYSQVFFVDGGASLGRNKENFLRKYFMQLDYKGYKWGFQPGGLERLTEAIKDVVFLADDAAYEASLPALENITVPIVMPKEAWKHYDAMRDELCVELDSGDIEAPNMAVMYGKLQQICCGALYSYTPDGFKDNGKPKFIKHTNWIHKQKFEQLSHLVGTFTGPTMVMYQFDFELEFLKAAYPHAVVLGDDPAAAERAWNDGQVSVLLCHPKSSSHGVNLQFGGHRIVWLSPVWSADQADQTIRRLRRRGQEAEAVFQYFLTVFNTVEGAMLRRYTHKETSAKDFIQHLRERKAA